MAQITLGGEPVRTAGDLPAPSAAAPAFTLTAANLSTVTSAELAGLTARSAVVLDTDGAALHSELVPEIAPEPDHDAALGALG